MATYDSVLAKNRKDQNEKAEKEYTKRAAANTEITNTYISDMNTIVDSAAENSAGKIQREIDALPTAYQSAFDANAIQQKINERNVRENMANLGMTDSGLNRTQQTAINIQRANADAALVQQKNAASNSLKQQIADIYASAENQKLEYAAKANADLKSTNESLRQSLFDNAENNAITIANNWLDNETAKQKARIEQETAQQKAEWDYKTETAKANINAKADAEKNKINQMIKSGKYDFDDSGNVVPVVEESNTDYTKPTTDILQKALGLYITKGEKAYTDFLSGLGEYDIGTIDDYVQMYSNINNWTVTSKGGWNLSGIDRNAKIKDKLGNEISLKEFRDLLTTNGWSRDEANKYLMKLQNELGISIIKY